MVDLQNQAGIITPEEEAAIEKQAQLEGLKYDVLLKEAAEKKRQGVATGTVAAGQRKDKLTPEKLREREEFLKKYPQFAAIASQGTIDDVAHMSEQPTEDNLAPALRVPGNH